MNNEDEFQDLATGVKKTLDEFYKYYSDNIESWIETQSEDREKANQWKRKVYKIGAVPFLLFNVLIFVWLGLASIYFYLLFALSIIIYVAVAHGPTGDLDDKIGLKIEAGLWAFLKLLPLPQEYALDTQLFYKNHILEEHNKVKAGKAFTGRDEGVEFSAQHFSLKNKTSGNEYLRVFRGILVYAEFDNEFTQKTLILKDRGKLLNSIVRKAMGSGFQRINMSYKEFEDLYEVYAADQVEGRSLLSPDVMSILIDLQNVIPECEWIQILMSGNKFYMAIDTGMIDNFDFTFHWDEKIGNEPPENLVKLAKEMAVIRVIMSAFDVLKRKKK